MRTRVHTSTHAAHSDVCINMHTYATHAAITQAHTELEPYTGAHACKHTRTCRVKKLYRYGVTGCLSLSAFIPPVILVPLQSISPFAFSISVYSVLPRHSVSFGLRGWGSQRRQKLLRGKQALANVALAWRDAQKTPQLEHNRGHRGARRTSLVAVLEHQG